MEKGLVAVEAMRKHAERGRQAGRQAGRRAAGDAQDTRGREESVAALPSTYQPRNLTLSPAVLVGRFDRRQSRDGTGPFDMIDSERPDASRASRRVSRRDRVGRRQWDRRVRGCDAGTHTGLERGRKAAAMRLGRAARRVV